MREDITKEEIKECLRKAMICLTYYSEGVDSNYAKIILKELESEVNRRDIVVSDQLRLFNSAT